MISRIALKTIGHPIETPHKNNGIVNQFEAIQQIGDSLLEEADTKMDEMQVLPLLGISQEKDIRRKNSAKIN